MWCFAGSLDFSLEDLSGEGTSPLLGSTVGKAFISVKESVRGGFNWATEGNPIRAAAAGKGSSQADEGPATRFRPANGDEDCRSSPGIVRDRSSSQSSLTLPRPAPWPRSQPGRHQAAGARRRQVLPPRAGSPRTSWGPVVARLGRQPLQLVRRQKGQGGKLLRLLLRPRSRRDVSGCSHEGLRKPLRIPPRPFWWNSFVSAAKRGSRRDWSKLGRLGPKAFPGAVSPRA